MIFWQSCLYSVRKCAQAAIPRYLTPHQPQVANSTEDYLAQPNHFPTPKSAVSRHLTYRRNLQRSESRLAYLRYNIHQVHRRHNLPNSALNRVPEVMLAARLKYRHAVTGLWGAAHD